MSCSPPFRQASLVHGKLKPLPSSEQDVQHSLICMSVARNDINAIVSKQIGKQRFALTTSYIFPIQMDRKYRDCIFQNERLLFTSISF